MKGSADSLCIGIDVIRRERIKMVPVSFLTFSISGSTSGCEVYLIKLLYFLTISW